MNYTTLFPNLLKSVPNIPQDAFCYNYNSKINYNKRQTYMKVFIPYGKRQLLWFTKCSGKYYCVLMETHNLKITKCHFKYISFEPILTNGIGTLIWVTQVGREICLNKIIYYKGDYCKLKTCESHMVELKYVLENYINNIVHSSLIQLKLPSMSKNKNFLLTAINLGYTSHSVVELTNNFTRHCHTFFANFIISSLDERSDIYKLSCIDENGNTVFYDNALINNKINSLFVKDILRIPHIFYENVEYSDNEDDDKTDRNSLENVMVACLFNTVHMKWMPYKLCDRKSRISTMSSIKKIRELSLRCIG